MFPDHRGNAFFGNLSNMHRKQSFPGNSTTFARRAGRHQLDAGRNPETL